MANITTKDGTHIYYKESDQELTRGCRRGSKERMP